MKIVKFANISAADYFLQTASLTVQVQADII